MKFIINKMLHYRKKQYDLEAPYLVSGLLGSPARKLRGSIANMASSRGAGRGRVAVRSAMLVPCQPLPCQIFGQ